LIIYKLYDLLDNSRIFWWFNNVFIVSINII
jgi:hypothetical protein